VKDLSLKGRMKVWIYNRELKILSLKRRL
jgi:hypothetical protein